VRLRKAKLLKRKRSILYAGAAVLIILIILLISVFRKEPEKSIAVRPFNYLGDDLDKQYLADGVMEAILLNLSKIEDLRVVSKTSVEQYRDTDKTVNTICQELDVAYLLEGSFQKYGDNARLIVQLIKPGKERHVWSNEYDRKWTDIFSVQSEVAQTVAGELKVVIDPEEKKLIEKIPTKNMTAYDAFLKGNEYSGMMANPNDLDTAMHYYELAIEKDPQLALAYTGIAVVWQWRHWKWVVSSDEATRKIKEACERALELDSTLAEAHYMLAAMHIWQKWDWKAADEASKKAIAINPNYADIHAAYSLLLTFLGRPEEAMEHIELALKLDPHNLFTKYLYSHDLIRMGRYEECISVCRDIIEKDPTYGLEAAYPLYTALHVIGRYEESLEAMGLHYRAFLNDFDHVFDQYEKLGYTGTLKLEIDTLLAQSISKSVPPTYLAELYIYTGDKEGALDCLEQMYEMRIPNLPVFMTDPNYYDSLRDEPRFQELLRKMNLPVDEKE
jgi:TolB-like protein/cytochrome c-type biogenesis protein CcmH/NrfG